MSILFTGCVIGAANGTAYHMDCDRDDCVVGAKLEWQQLQYCATGSTTPCHTSGTIAL